MNINNTGYNMNILRQTVYIGSNPNYGWFLRFHLYDGESDLIVFSKSLQKVGGWWQFSLIRSYL